MSLLNNYRKYYIAACLVTAVFYALAMGVNLPLIVRLADGFVYGIILFSVGIILWNIFRFAIPVHYTPKFRIVFIVTFLVIFGLFITGIETFANYLCFPASFDSFVPTLPARFFITLLLLVIIYLYYLYNDKINGDGSRNSNILLDQDLMDSPMNSLQTGGFELYSTSPNQATSPNQTTSPIQSTPSVALTQQAPTALPVDRITVRSGQKIQIIPFDSIIFIQADGDYITIHTAEGKWLKEQTMKYTEELLPANYFIRVHRSFIVNIHYISRIERYGEQQLIVLHNNKKIKISAARYQLLRQILGI